MLPELWHHQSRAIELALPRDEFALFFEPGTGKTRTAIEILNKKMALERRFLKTLILCPLSVIGVWERELKQNGFVTEQLIICDKSGAQRQVRLKNGLYDSGTQKYTGQRIVVINYEAVILKDALDIIRQWGPEVLICDESHRLKSHEAKRSKMVYELSKSTKYRYLLSGTPMLRDPQDLFMQMKILDGGATFGTNAWAYKNIYFWDRNANWRQSQNYFPKYEVRPEAIQQILQKMASLSMSVLKKDALDLPPLVRQTIYTELSKEQKSVYEDMKREMISYLDANKEMAAVATIALTKALRLQQIVSGFVTHATGEYKFKQNPRLDLLKDLVSDLVTNHKVIIWACFKENYRMLRGICEDLNIKCVELHGEVPGAERARNIKEFQENDEVRVMIANQGAGGIGVDMTAASYMIYFSKNFSLEHDVQSEARNYRGGSERHESITRIDLVSPGTIDEPLNLALANKQAIGYELLQGLRR